MGTSWKWRVLERMGQSHSTHSAVQPDILEYPTKQGIRWSRPSTKRDTWQNYSPFQRGDLADLSGCRNLCLQQLVGAQRGKGGWRVAKRGLKVSCCDSDQVLTTNCPGISSSAKKAVTLWGLFSMSVWITTHWGDDKPVIIDLKLDLKLVLEAEFHPYRDPASSSTSS